LETGGVYAGDIAGDAGENEGYVDDTAYDGGM
jgi:hypothetical protein